MDVLDFINRNGQRVVANPAYNPRSKKNKQPSSIIVPDIAQPVNDAVELARQDATRQYFIDSHENEKYRREGLNWNPRENFDVILDERQSNWSKLGNALAQTVVSEIGLGTAKAFSDIIGGIAEFVGIGEADYSNPVSQFLENKQEQFKEWAPVYHDPSKDIFNGGLTDFGWYMSNLPSIASSITLLIPGRAASGVGSRIVNAVNRVSGLGNNTLTRRLARGVTKAVGTTTTEAGVRLNRIGQVLNDSRNIKLVNEIAKDFGTAAAMRLAENYQESRQTYSEVYDIASQKLNDMSDEQFTEWYNRHKDEVSEEDFINNDRDAIAKKIAKKSADTTFNDDAWNVFFDVAQLWGLRNATKIFRNVNSTKIRADHRASIEQLGKTSEEVSKLSSEASKLSKMGNTLKDVFRGTGKAAVAESTEGIEEMVNYVAQQEGITAGKLLLDEATPTDFSTRLSGYWHSPELWESAFWGVMGGVVFQGAGSAYNQFNVKRAAKKRQEERKKDAKTKEEVNASAWYELEELPEIKAARAAINKRNSRTTDMFGKISRINDGFNIFAKEDPITKTTPKFEGTEDQIRLQQDKARESVVNEYLADIVADAIHSGTYDTLMEYFTSDQMKAAMINNGVITEEEANSFTTAIKDKADHIRQTYNDQIRHLSSQANYINYTNGNAENKIIPMEYVQMIAKENLDHILVRENLNDQEKIVDDEIALTEASPALENVIEKGVPYTDVMTLGTLSSTYSDLEAQKRKIKNDESISDLDKFIATSNIERKQKLLLGKLETITSVGGKVSPSLGRVLFTLQAAAKASYNGEGKVVYDMPTEDFEKTDKELLENAGYNLSDIELEDAAKLSLAYNEDLSVFDNLVQEAKREIDENDSAAKTLKETSAKLFDLYQQKSNIELAKLLNDSEINTTQSDFIRRVDEIHNQVNELRHKAVANAGDVVISIYDKYKKINQGKIVNRAVSLILEGKRNQAIAYMKRNFEQDEAEKLIDAFDILNLNSDTNLKLARYISLLISGKDDIDAKNAREGVDDEVISDEEITDDEGQFDVDVEEPVEEEIQPEPKENKNKKFKGKNRKQRKREKMAQRRAEREAAEREAAEAANNAQINSSTGEQDISPQSFIDRMNNTDNSAEVDVIFKEGLDAGIPEEELFPTYSKRQKEIDDAKREREAKEQQEEETPPPAYPLDQLVEELDSAIKDIVPELIQQIKNNTSFNVNESINELKQKALDSQRDNLTDEQYDELTKILTDKLNDVANRLKRVQEVLNKTNATLNESAEAVVLSSKIGVIGNENLPDIIIEGIENFINKYLDASISPIKDGKKVINVKELLLVATNSVSDINAAPYVLEKLKAYLNTENVRDKYYIIDSVTLDRDAANLTSDSQTDNINSQQQDMRINIADYIEFYNDTNVSSEEESKKYFETLESLRTGDSLDLVLEGSNIFISKNGIVIGSGAIPAIEGNRFKQGNKGWLEDVGLNPGGEVVSDALERYKDIFTSDDLLCDELRLVILDAIQAGRITDAIADKFKNTGYIKEALKNNPEYFVNDGNSLNNYVKPMLEHLVALYNYSTQNITFTDKASKIQAINNGLENYFYNLYQTYDTVSKITDNAKVTISYINDGQVLIPFENSEAKNHHSELPFAKDAIADRTTTRLSIYNAIDNTVHVSGHEALENRGLKNTQSILTLFDRNGQPTFVTLDYLNLSDYNYSRGLQTLTTYAKTEFQNLLERLVSKEDEDSSVTFSQIDDILHSIIATDERDRISLFRGLSGRGAVIDTRPGDYPGYVITNLYFKHDSSQRGKYIRFTKNAKGKIKFKIFDGTNNESYDITKDNINKVGAQVFNFVLENATTEVSTYGIESDNNPNMVITKGFIQRRNGKLVTVFGSTVTEYYSYNDFIIDNDLIRVNLTKNDRGSNRTPRGSKQMLNQVMYVQANVESSPVEKIDESKQVPPAIDNPNINKETYNNILDIFKQDRVSGKDLFIAAIGEERYAEFLNEAAGMNILDTILPTSIKYHPSFNYTTSKGTYIGTEAATNTSASDKFVKVGKADGSGQRTNIRLKSGQVVVGDVFLSELASIKGSDRIRGIAVMIHEKLHDIIANNPDYTKEEILNAIRPICDEFIAGCNLIMENNEPSSILYRQAENALKGLSQYDNRRLYKDDSVKIEEFLVETITNSDFIDLMNSIDATDNQAKGKENILTKLMNLLLKYFFKTDIKQGKLLEKEMKALSNLIADKQAKREESQKSIVKEVSPAPSSTVGPAKPIVKRIILGKKPNNTGNVDDDYADLSNIGVIKTDNNSRLDGFLSAIPTEQNLKFASMREAGTLQYACKY